MAVAQVVSSAVLVFPGSTAVDGVCHQPVPPPTFRGRTAGVEAKWKLLKTLPRYFSMSP